MTDSKNSNSEKTNPRPVIETIPDDEPENVSGSGDEPEKFVPEELSEETPEDLTLSDLTGGSPPGNGAPVIDDASFGDSNMKKYLFIGAGVIGVIVIFIVIFSVLMSLRGGGKEATLEYWGLWEDESVMNVIIQDYQRENPNITINYEKKSPTEYREKLVAQANEGRGPDIFRFHNTWLPSIIEIAAPLPNSVMSKDTFEELFYPVIQNDLSYQGSYYGISLGIDGLVLVYNNELLRYAGIESAPRTWDELVNAADAVHVQTDQNRISTAGIAIGTANNIEHFSDIFGWMLMQNGGTIHDLTSEPAVGALETYRSFAEPQVNLWSADMPRDINAFVESKVAMIIVPSWEILTIKEANADLDIRVAPLPVLPASDPVAFASYWVEGVSKASRNQEEAWKFLEYMSRKDVMTKLYQEQTKVRLFGVPYSRVDLRETLLENEYIGPILEQAPNMKSLPMTTRTYDNVLNDAIAGYIRNAINASAEGVDYAQAMSTAQSGISGILEEYNIQP